MTQWPEWFERLADRVREEGEVELTIQEILKLVSGNPEQLCELLANHFECESVMANTHQIREIRELLAKFEHDPVMDGAQMPGSIIFRPGR